ncbi:hypothetical protein GGX14DRAFT_624098 [Mycena pura]|uniref:Uncharacterized protein n=1 Tax=Mycena pura TaxID=153505 RepID=A0AAD6VJD1_9AGAR|nr:hypothetical protein GGX14DRAFT_624098 [Mycena pura]
MSFDCLLDQKSYELQLERLRAFYQKSWGHIWPTHELVADIPTDDSDDATASDSDDDDSDAAMAIDSVSRVFTVYDDMKEVATALGLSMFLPAIVIREEYKYLHGKLEKKSESVQRKYAAVVTGQPGIGKTTFLVYLLLQRLQQKKPTAFQVKMDHFCLFDEEGVALLTVKEPACKRLGACWALVGSNASLEKPCELFTSEAMVIVQTASPEPAKWKGWLKQLLGDVIVSELPTTLEIAAIAKEFKLDATLTGRLVRKWGPSTKNIITLLEHWGNEKMKWYLEKNLRDDVEAAARAVLASPEGLFAMLIDTNARALSSTGSAAVFVRPFQGEGRRWLSRSQVFIPTEYLAGIVGNQSTQLANADVLKLFAELSTHSFTKSPASWKFEMDMHRLLCGGGAAIIINKFSGFGEIFGQKMVMTPATELLPGTLNALASASSSDAFYWLPYVTNFPGIDGVLGDRDGNVFAVQSTFNAEHVGPEEGLVKAWTHMARDVRETRSWHFVAVANTAATARNLGRIMTKQLETFTLGKTKVHVWSCSLSLR